MRLRVSLMVSCVLLLASTVAHADTRVGFDCYLGSDAVSCRELQQAFEASVPGVEVGSEQTLFTVRLRDAEVAGARRYFADFEGRPMGERARDEPVRFTLTSEIPTSAGADRTLLLLVALLQRGTVPFMEVSAPGDNEGGVLRLSVSAGDGRTEATSPTTGWYFRPQVAGQLVEAGVQIRVASAELELSYSDREWRWRTTAQGSYRYFNVQLGDDRLEGDFASYRGRTHLVRSLYEGLSTAATVGARREPQNNLVHRADVGVGLEWVLAPFLRANETNIGARLVASGVYDEYVTQTLFGDGERLYFEPSLTLFGRVHTEPVDVEISLRSALIADQPEFWSVGGDLEATFRLFEGLQLSLAGGLLYRGAAVHAPADANELNPVATTLAGSNFGELTLSTRVSLSWAFGNSLLRSQDQRWR